jgi:hypothetical protein
MIAKRRNAIARSDKTICAFHTIAVFGPRILAFRHAASLHAVLSPTGIQEA